jgi:hypothetical protein
MAKGGAIPGSGRKSKAEEFRVRTISLKAISNVLGGEVEAFEYCLRSEEPSLIKFALEHAFGKPQENIKHEGLSFPNVIFMPDERFSSKDNSDI